MSPIWPLTWDNRGVTSAPRSKRNPVRLAEDRDQARKAQTAGWLKRQHATAPPLTQAEIDQLRPVLAPVLHLMRGA